MEFIAHIKAQEVTSFAKQTLEEHLRGTSKLAAGFAAKFHNSSWGEVIGLWHDLGKYSDEFQDYIKKNSGYEEGEKLGKTDHTSAAAILAKERFPQHWPPISYCIAGHHAGMHNWLPDIGISSDLSKRLNKTEFLEKIKAKIPAEFLKHNNFEPPTGKAIHPEHMHLWIRMLFSCLVDADYFDTERFMNPESFNVRQQYDTLHELKNRFDRSMKMLLDNATQTRVNIIRSKILMDCLEAGQLTPGFFSITVPTGGGKTLSTMAWALEHAIAFNKSRIIFAIPYTSIITQTAQIYREIFGENNVVEHHCNIDEDINSQERKLAAENWDAPIIVTTNIQLFESLYANKTSRCRKLHNLANSIIILDEAQMLPPEFLRPIISTLHGLVNNFGASLMLSTATQPALTGKIGGNGKNSFEGIPSDAIREVIKDTGKLSEALKRVEIHLPVDINKPIDWHTLSNEIKQHEQVLCIVNTRNQCKDLYALMPEGTIHLSRLMCTAHIMDNIAEIKSRLKNKLPVRVVSTQLIEAGVDIDFPVVYRAIAGLDSIAQSAGRCNREGSLNQQNRMGYLKVFVPDNGSPIGLMRKGADTFKEIISFRNTANLFEPWSFIEYFRLFYSRVDNFDKPEVKALLWQDARQMRFQFATAAKEFRLINDKNAQAILVRYNDGSDLIELLKRKGPEPWIMRKLQRFSVSVNERDFEEIRNAGLIAEIHGCWIQDYPNLYNTHSGIQHKGKWLEEIHII